MTTLNISIASSPLERAIRELDGRSNERIDVLLLCNSHTHRVWVAAEDGALP